MGQQPNIELGMSDLPRPTPQPAPARRWRPGRPGDLATPSEVPWGGAFGTTGPDAGFALRIVSGRDVPLTGGEGRRDADALIAGVAAARASRVGRAPTNEDVDAALVLLGYDTRGIPQGVADDLAARRRRWVSGAAHHPARVHRVVGSISPDVLVLEPAAILDLVGSGAVLVP